MAKQKFEIEIEYLAGSSGYTEGELREFLSTHLQDYDTEVYSVKEITQEHTND